jgi:GH141 insertion domain/Right handed beta helix region
MRVPQAVTLLFAGWITVLTAPAPGAEPLDIFVATNGNNQWSGRLAAPNATHTDGPLASLVGARDVLRRARSKAEETPGAATAHVRGGTYRMEAPLLLEPQDSGTAEAPVTFTAYQDERPVLSGGEVVSGFRQVGPRWEAVIPDVKTGRWYFRQLFVNGQRRQRARSPNKGYHRIAALVPGPPRRNAKPVAPDRFIFEPGDLRPWERLADVNVILMHSWETSIHPLKSVDVTSNLVTFAAPLKEWWGLGYWETNQRYYVENALELLDQPGEWYLNRDTGVLTYWPLRGEQIGETEVVAPRLTEFVRFSGNADKGEFVRHVTLRGLTFHHAGWVLDPKGNSSTQAAVEVPAAITADGALDCAVEGCEVAHVGTCAIWFRRGCKNGRIQRNRLFDLGAGGLRVGEARMAKSDAAETSRTLVDNNHIFNGGRVYAGCVGIWLAQSSGNRISHNDLHDLYYTGISVGWNWGLEPNRTSNNVIEFNHVHDLGDGVLSDMGLIYCLGVSPGSVIRNNVFHDIWPYSNPAFGWGIYLDAHCGNYLVESNLVYNTQSGGLMFNNGGHEHVIRNNIFALSATHALWPYSEQRPSTFRCNIVYLTQGALFIPYGERSLDERLAAKEPLGDWDENVYWHTGGADRLRFYHRSFAEWQALGLDKHSLVADPQFVNAAHHDFRLRPGSPALKLGFKPFDIRQAGLYGDPAWTKEASHANRPKTPLSSP